jgi:hypothetical protein
MNNVNRVNKCAEDVTLTLELRNFECLPIKKVEPYKHTAVTGKEIFLGMEVYLYSAMSSWCDA